MTRTYIPPKCGYTIEDGCIRSDGTVRNRISGTQVAGILGESPWSSPFQVACQLLGVAREDISEKPATMTGRALERRIIDYVKERYSEQGTFIPAAELYEKREGDHDTWPSDFEDNVFSGHVDGLVVTDDGNSYILEVKTSANMESWQNGVPEYYYWQIALYNHFMTAQDKAWVALGIVSDEDRRRPSKWKPSESNVVLFEMDIDQDEVSSRIEDLREWYDEYIMNGVTPPYNPSIPGDVEMFDHLMSLSDDLSAKEVMLSRLVEIENEIDASEENLKPLCKTRDALRKNLKEYMEVHGMDEMMTSDSKWMASMSSSTKTFVDPVMMMEDGIDPEPYTVSKVSKVFTVKPVRNN